MNYENYYNDFDDFDEESKTELLASSGFLISNTNFLNKTLQYDSKISKSKPLDSDLSDW
ncbi:hypothetical protein [Chryseobacterium sp. JK1]|uniref:hypothetical protein n=1 Tax=Chryseobacterium sp. JK1 TaxID=874294 RepID=UPI003D6973D6